MGTITFWKEKRVLVTGHTGFTGSWLLSWLKLMEARVVGVSLEPPTEPNMFDCCNLGTVIDESHIVDINDFGRLQTVCSTQAFDVVFHLAAQPLVSEGFSNPVATFSTNTMGTLHLLEALRGQPQLGAIVVVTTDKVYENSDNSSVFAESDRLGGVDPYGASKACAELVANAYRCAFFQGKQPPVGVATARAGNLIGGGDWSSNRIVPDCVRGFLRGEPVVIRSPYATRPWQHVLNAVHGYLDFAKSLYQMPESTPSALNFGPSNDAHVPVKHLVEQLAVELPFSWEIDEGNKIFPEKAALKLDSSLAFKTLQWQPRLGLAEGLKLIASWTKSFQAQENMQQVTFGQINLYQDRLRE